MTYLFTTLAAFLLGLTMRSGVRYTGLRWDLQRALIRKRDDYKFGHVTAGPCTMEYGLNVTISCQSAREGSHSPFNLRMLCKTCHDERHNKFDKMKG